MKSKLALANLFLAMGLAQAQTSSNLNAGNMGANPNAAAQVAQLSPLLQKAMQAQAQGDMATGFKYLLEAAQQGDVVAQYNLSVAYSNGDGVAANETLAIDWLTKAANQGHFPAQYDLAIYYLSKKQPALAAPWMKKCADAGSAPAQFNYGKMLLKGDGVAKDVALGKRYIQQSAAQEFPPAQQLLPQL